MKCEESACLGVAMLSCVANGIYGGLAEARESMVHIRERVQPDPQTCERYSEIYTVTCDFTIRSVRCSTRRV